MYLKFLKINVVFNKTVYEVISLLYDTWLQKV